MRWLRLFRWLPFCERLGETREEYVLRRCGCVCYCPGCGDILNDKAEVHDSIDGVSYFCPCGRWSLWDFDSFPAPMLVVG